ncbi:MAG: NAD(P)-binding domain-containing protein [Acidobacteriota bacterium]|nr:NAD(P)-binding domain-containing protein [Acidobacteriota bacterium]
MPKPVVVIPGDDPPQCEGSPQLERLGSVAEVVLYPARPESSEEKIRRARQADVLINSRNSVKWPADVLKELPRLKMITVCGIGIDAIDIEAARTQEIIVCNVPGKTAPIVAEHAFGLMFAVAKRAAYQTASIRAGDWVRVDSLFLQGKTLGVVGTGNIGAEMARLGRLLGMRVIAWTFHPSAERAAQLGVTFVELEELLCRSDVVSLHLKLTEQSRHLIGESELSRMKPGAVLINVGRGALVDEEALAAALGAGHLGGAGVDVFQVEPLPPGHPLRACEQVVLTPHCADMTPEGVELLNEGVVDNVLAFLQGNPRNVMT